MSELLRSPLHDNHEALGAKFGEFGGWSMPLEYTGVVKEHAAVREAAGLFDVSHLGKAVVSGPEAAAFVNRTLSNDLERIGPGRAQYTLCCDEESGGIVDDLIVYYRDETHLLLVPNAANTAGVVGRLMEASPDGVTITDHHRDYAILAVQGPKSDDVLEAVGLPTDHDYMSFVEAALPDVLGNGTGVVVCRSGYTGERGYELIVAGAEVPALWDALMKAGEAHGMLPCGLGARDTLRTEMGYPLHGQDISLEITPNEAGLGWAVGWKKDAFWGRETLLAEREQGPARRLRGVISAGRAIPRPHMTVSDDVAGAVGEVTSGTFSPTLRKGVGLVLVADVVGPEGQVTIDVRGRQEPFELTKPPFVPAHVRD